MYNKLLYVFMHNRIGCIVLYVLNELKTNKITSGIYNMDKIKNIAIIRRWISL